MMGDLSLALDTITSHDESAARASALAQVDDLATRALDWIAPIRLGVAQSDEARKAAYRLRYQTVVERGWARPEDYPDGLERDAYDDKAIHILAWDGDVPVATARLVLPQPGLCLPTEAAFDLRIEPRGQVVDVGRFVVTRPYSGIEHRVLAILLARCWLEARAHGFSCVCAAFASNAMIRVYRRMGFQITILAPARLYWGEERYPIRINVAESGPTLVRRWLTEDKIAQVTG